MVAMPVPDCDVDAIKDALLDKYSIEIPVFKWQDTCIVRLSVQGYNSKPQMDLLIDALTDLLDLKGAAERRVS
jgi:isopenicillin-N epimerase